MNLVSTHLRFFSHPQISLEAPGTVKPQLIMGEKAREHVVQQETRIKLGSGASSQLLAGPPRWMLVVFRMQILQLRITKTHWTYDHIGEVQDGEGVKVTIDDKARGRIT
jgi:hypothetical protein